MDQAGHALGVHIRAFVDEMVTRKLGELVVAQTEVSVMINKAAKNPLTVQCAGQEFVFPLGEVVWVPTEVLVVLDELTQPILKDRGMGLTEVVSGIEYEVMG